MADTYTLHLQNFRSIRDAKIEIAPLTVIYGPNGSGKSSLIYGLLTLKNFLTNPNQNVASLFSYPSISLGGLQEVVHRHAVDKEVSLALGVCNPGELSSKFTLTLDQSGGEATMSFDFEHDSELWSWPDTLGLEIPIPYGANQTVDHDIELHYGGLPSSLTLTWNGVTMSAQIHDYAEQGNDRVRRRVERSNLPMELARRTGFVPLRRGFSKPAYGLASVTLRWLPKTK